MPQDRDRVPHDQQRAYLTMVYDRMAHQVMTPPDPRCAFQTAIIHQPGGDLSSSPAPVSDLRWIFEMIVRVLIGFGEQRA